MFEEYKDVLNVNDLCHALGIGKNTCYKLLNSGDIKSKRIGNLHKIPKVYLVEYVMSNTEAKSAF